MAEIRTLKLNLLADTSKFNKGLNQAGEETKSFGSKIGSFAKTAAVAFAAVALGAAAVGRVALSFVKAAEESDTANKRIQNIAKSMDLFGDKTGVVSKRLIDYAKSIAISNGVDQNQIKLTQAKLLTFAQLAKTADQAGGAFDRATKAAIDLAAAGFGSAEQNATQLGKALQDPIKGITALARSGVTFTEQEKEKIKVLVESNQMLAAQDMVLKAIEKQVGGTAAATANATDKMRVGFSIIKEEIGVFLFPVFERFSNFVTEKLLPTVKKIADGFAGRPDSVSNKLKILQEQMGDGTTDSGAYNFGRALRDVAEALNKLFAAMNSDDAKTGPSRLQKTADALVTLANAIEWVTKKYQQAEKIFPGLGLSLNPFGSGQTPGRATGGTVSSGQAYRVGEFGPETFIPNGSGRIVPSASSGNVTINLNGIIDAESARRAIERIMQDSTRRTGALNFAGAAF